MGAQMSPERCLCVGLCRAHVTGKCSQQHHFNTAVFTSRSAPVNSR
jgi:hypothetical protein